MVARPDWERARAQSPKRSAKIGARMARLNWFVREKQRELSGTERAVWLVVWSWDYRQGGAELSGNALAEAAGVSRVSAVRAVTKLLHKGLLKQVRKGRIGDQRPSIYRTAQPKEGSPDPASD